MLTSRAHLAERARTERAAAGEEGKDGERHEGVIEASAFACLITQGHGCREARRGSGGVVPHERRKRGVHGSAGRLLGTGSHAGEHAGSGHPPMTAHARQGKQQSSALEIVRWPQRGTGRRAGGGGRRCLLNPPNEVEQFRRTGGGADMGMFPLRDDYTFPLYHKRKE